MSGSDLCAVDFDEIVHETDLAYLVRDGDGDEHWLPKSQCEVIATNTCYITMQMPEWLAEEKGLI